MCAIRLCALFARGVIARFIFCHRNILGPSPMTGHADMMSYRGHPVSALGLDENAEVLGMPIRGRVTC